MPYSRPSLSALQAQALADIAAGLPTGTPLHGSVLRVLGLAQAGLVQGNYGYLDWIAKQSVPFTATEEFLEAWAALKGISRQQPTAATGTAALTGTAGVTIPAGTLLARGDGALYSVAADTAVANNGTVTLSITAALTGAAGNVDAGTTLTLASPVIGVQSGGSAATALIGGTDAEDDDSLRSRMLQKYASPPQGGAQSDYLTWALAVPGVTRAWANPNGAGAGSVVVYAMLDVAQAGNGGYPVGTTGTATLETRAATATGDLLTIADALYPQRPATALVYAAAPLPQAINITIANLLPNTTAIQTAISAALRDLYTRIGTPLGMTVYTSDISGAIESVAGITHFTLVSPAAPVTIAVGKLPALGTLGATS